MTHDEPKAGSFLRRLGGQLTEGKSNRDRLRLRARLRIELEVTQWKRCPHETVPRPASTDQLAAVGLDRITDIALNAAGEASARAFPSGVDFSHVLTSPSQRTWRTREWAGLSAGARIEPELAEWDHGDYEGIRSLDIRKARPDWGIYRDGCPFGGCRRKSPREPIDY